MNKTHHCSVNIEQVEYQNDTMYAHMQ